MRDQEKLAAARRTITFLTALAVGLTMWFYSMLIGMADTIEDLNRSAIENRRQLETQTNKVMQGNLELSPAEDAVEIVMPRVMVNRASPESTEQEKRERRGRPRSPSSTPTPPPRPGSTPKPRIRDR